ncbi:MAG: cation transporter [Oscillospiraceae bacterium]|nr:cation transporter [Oscillospiraceae bacterium]
MEKKELFENTVPGKALATMALPTIASQIIILIYNLADTWFIGRTNNPYMVAASSLGLTIYLAAVALANVFGTGGGALMVRLIGEKRTEEARSVASYSVAAAAIGAAIFSLLVLSFLEPLLKMLGASSNTLNYAKQYVFATSVLGGIPTVLSMTVPTILRDAGFPKEAGIGVGIGSLLNVALDPIFMFLLLPRGQEVLGAGIATMLSNCCSLAYFIVIYRKLRDTTVLVIPRRMEKIGREAKRSLYSVGIPAAFAIFLFDLVTIVINRLTASYGDIPLAAMGIVLKLERIPINIGLGICLGMVPLVAYNYGAGNYGRMHQVSSLARTVILVFSCACVLLFWVFARPVIAAFISNEETVTRGAAFLRGRCLALPFMMIGYHSVNYMNAVNRGKVSFLLAIVRHLVLIIPVMLLMNRIWGLVGLTWSQLAADFLNAIVAVLIFRHVDREIRDDIPV